METTQKIFSIAQWSLFKKWIAFSNVNKAENSLCKHHHQLFFPVHNASTQSFSFECKFANRRKKGKTAI